MKCYLCGEKIKDDQKYHFDHVIPLIKGGPQYAKQHKDNP